MFGTMYERREWFVYNVRTKFAKKTKIDRRLVLAVFIGFWTHAMPRGPSGASSDPLDFVAASVC